MRIMGSRDFIQNTIPNMIRGTKECRVINVKNIGINIWDLLWDIRSCTSDSPWDL